MHFVKVIKVLVNSGGYLLGRNLHGKFTVHLHQDEYFFSIFQTESKAKQKGLTLLMGFTW